MSQDPQRAGTPAQPTPQKTDDVCVVCQCPGQAGEQIGRCPACQALHHHECWTYNGGCGVYGCDKAATNEGLSSLEIPASHWGREDKQCPNCGNVILAAAVRCRHCGATFSSATPQASGSFHQQNREKAKLPAVRVASIWLLVFSFIPCTAPFAAVIGTIWYFANAKAIQSLPSTNAALCKIAVGVAWLTTVILLGVYIMFPMFGADPS